MSEIRRYKAVRNRGEGALRIYDIEPEVFEVEFVLHYDHERVARRVDEMSKELLLLAAELDVLRKERDDRETAVRSLYFAAIWHADRDVDEASLWERVRDTHGFVPGESSAALAALDAQGEEETK